MTSLFALVSDNPYLFIDLTDQTPQEILDQLGVTDPAFYAEFDSADFDAASYNFPSAFTLVGGVVGFNLAIAKTQASSTVKSQTATEQQAALAGYTSEVLASQAILPELSRTPEIQVVLEAVNDLNTALQSELADIAAATTIEEVNNIVNPPTPPPANTFNVTNNGSGNYVINGASNPTLTLAGGITYTFNISAPGHPFWIKTTQTTGTANIYNTGVTNNGTDDGVITFVVLSTGVPSPLYYNCQYHASMAGVLNMTL